MPVEGLDSIFTEFEGRRPGAIAKPPARGEVRKLRDRLARYGNDDSRLLTKEACDFLASAVAEPASVRAQLNRPNLRPTLGGSLEVVYATVPLYCLVPDPGNGRVVGATPWPAADQGAGQTLKLWAPSDLQVHEESNCEVVIQADTLAEFKTVLQEAADRTKQLNPRMREKVERDGVLDPLLCQVMHVHTADGHGGLSLVTRDGSTRCAFSKEIHRVDAYDGLFGASRDADVRRNRWVEMNDLYESPLESVSGNAMAKLRTFLVPVQIVVGFVPDDDKVNVLDAVDEIVRRTHVETSYPWLPVAQSNSQADQVLGALRSHATISESQFLLFGGKLSRSQRIERGLPAEPDGVLAEILRAFGAGTMRKDDEFHTVLRRATGAGRITPQFKAELVGSLGLRQFPQADGRMRAAANTTLIEALRLSQIWDCPWEHTERSPEQLREAALEELDHGGPGPAARELAVKAVGFLAAQGWLKSQISGSRGGADRDQRAPNVVIDVMLSSRQGIHVLAEAMTAGRRGESAKAVDPAGESIEQVSGDPKALANEWIRQTFTESPAVKAPLELPGAQTPQEQASRKIHQIEEEAEQITRLLEEAIEIEGIAGGSYLNRHGFSATTTEPIAEKLREAAKRLELFGVLANASIPDVATETEVNETPVLS